MGLNEKALKSHLSQARKVRVVATAYWKGDPKVPGTVTFTGRTVQRGLVAVDPKTGRQLWRYPWETGYDTNNPDPLTYHNTVFISTYSRGCALLAVANGGAFNAATMRTIAFRRFNSAFTL